MKITEKSLEVLNYCKEAGGRVSIEELATALGRTARSVSANVTDLCSEKKGLAVRVKVAGDGEDAKPVSYVELTEAGKNFVPTED